MENFERIIELLTSTEYTMKEKYRIYEEAVNDSLSILTEEEIEEAKQALPSTDEETRNKMYSAMKIASKLNEIDPAIMIELEKIRDQINREEDIKEQFEKADQDFSDLLGRIKNMTETREGNKESEEEIEETETHEEGTESSDEEPEEEIEEIETHEEGTESSDEEPEEEIVEKREIEKIRDRIFENYNISLGLTKDFVKENTQLVKEKLIDYITNSNIDENKKQSHLDRLNSENLTSEQIITVMQSEKVLEDNQFIISIIEEELAKEVKDDNKQQEIENTKKQIEEIDREIDAIKNSSTESQSENPQEEPEEEQKLNSELGELSKQLQQEQEKLASFNLEINAENKKDIIEITKLKLNSELEKISSGTLTIGRELGEKRTNLIRDLNKLNIQNLTDEELLNIINDNNINSNIQIDILEKQKSELEATLKVNKEQNIDSITSANYYDKNDIIKYLNEIIEKEIQLIPRTLMDRVLAERKQELIKLQQELKKQGISYEELYKIIDFVNKDKKYNIDKEIKEQKLKEIEKKLETIKQGKTSINNNIATIQQRIDEIKKKLEEIGQGKDQTQNNDERLKELEEKKRQLEEQLETIKQGKTSKLEEQLQKFKEHDNKDLNEIKNAYFQIRDNIISDLSRVQDFTNKTPQEQMAEIVSRVENHQLRSVLNKYSNEEKLLQELVEEIYNSLNKAKEKEEEKEEEKPKKDEKKWYKSLAFWSGFGIGFGASFIAGPIPGAIIIGSKITHKIAKPFLIKSIEKQEQAIIEKIQNGEEISKGSELWLKIKKALVSKNVEFFLNGASVGYVSGKIGQNLYEKFSIPKKTPTGTGGKIKGITPPPTPSIPGLGDTVDVRGIKAFVNSYGEGGTSIIQDLAKEAIIEKENNGFYHLIDRFGKDLGWYKISDIEQKAKMIKDVTTAVVRHTR